ncbi:hypothetical protein, partial [Phocaeicola dorei]|uniref:hypothetical protein n=1 Tax=Phocaeicola dorei TaxID=357276 RepID=UPI001E5DC0B9
EASGLEEVPEAFFGIHVWLRTLMPWKKAGNRTGRSEGPPNRETEDDYSAFMQAISLSTSSSSVSKEDYTCIYNIYL